jgi:hypothetical protein
MSRKDLYEYINLCLDDLIAHKASKGQIRKSLMIYINEYIMCYAGEWIKGGK